MEDLYNEKYFSERIPAEKDYHMAFQWLEWMSRFHKTNGTCLVLDYGCGTGKFASIFNYFNEGGYGYDPFLPDNALKGGVYWKDWSQRQFLDFDLVVAIDVFEHIPEDKVEENIKRIVSTAKRFIICSICDVTLWDSYQDKSHVTCKSREWWISQFEKHGLKYIEPPEDWLFRRQMYIFEKVK